MPKFFENIALNDNEIFTLSEENSRHCAKALRSKAGDIITVCNGGIDYECEIENISEAHVNCRVVRHEYCAAEPDISLTLYQCQPKGDKLESVIQKSVELGVYEICPVLSSRCVSRPDDKKSSKKCERYRKIAKSACEQSGRGRIVDVLPLTDYDNALKNAEKADVKILFYEGGGEPIRDILQNCGEYKSVAVLIGPEGGFSEDEVELAKSHGFAAATLGKRILRTETAPLAAISAIMLLSGNLE